MEMTARESDVNDVKVNIRQPKRVLQFCDGVMEEYSDDEEDLNNPDSKTETEEPPVNTREMDWGTWFAYKASATGRETLRVLENVGESLASFFGITDPKYILELVEAEKLEEEKRQREESAKVWSAKNTADTVTSQPSSNV